MRRFHCGPLDAEVELTEERERHIVQRHPDLLPRHVEALRETIAEPDRFSPSPYGSKHLLTRWVDTIRGGRWVVVVIVSDGEPPTRYWVVTAYLTRTAPADA